MGVLDLFAYVFALVTFGNSPKLFGGFCSVSVHGVYRFGREKLNRSDFTEVYRRKLLLRPISEEIYSN